MNLFTFINPIQDGLLGAAHRWEGGAGWDKKAHPP